MVRNWMQRLDLPEENLPGQPLVEILGCSRVLIEHHSGVLEYERERICVRVKYGCVCVFGRGLELARMSSEQLIISGCIEGIRLERRR